MPKAFGIMLFIAQTRHIFQSAYRIMRDWIILMMWISVLPAFAQEPSDLDQIVQNVIQDFTEFNDGGEDFDFNTLYEDLAMMYTDRLNINTATEDDLARLIFLSTADVQNIITYRKAYGDFVSVYELQAVPGLSAEELAWLKHFVKVSGGVVVMDPYLPAQMSRYSNYIYTKWKYNIETADQFKSIDGDPPKYIGDKHHIYLRYQHASAKQRFGVIIEKDPGEKFTTEGAELGVDYVSFHYQRNGVTPWLKQLNLGEFTVSLGQGLITHNGFGLGKSSIVTSIKKNSANIRSFNSVTENLSMRGIGLTIVPGSQDWKAIVFGSYAARDANPSEDEDGHAVFTSLPQGGLHRTAGEIEDIDGVYETTLGGTVQLQKWDPLRIGANVVHHQFDTPLQRNLQPYQIYRWQGDQLTNYSVDYSLNINTWSFFGEVAKNAQGGWAQSHGFLKSLHPTVDLAVLYRDFEEDYQALYANAFAENLTANNEQGLYIGAVYRPNRRWAVSAFADQWSNPWLRFRTDAPSQGKEYLLKVEYRKRRKWNYYVQYRYERKGENSGSDAVIDFPVDKAIQRLRGNATHHVTQALTLRSRLELSHFTKETDNFNGLLFYQDFIYKPIAMPFSISARLAYFNVDDFDARIYAFEQDLQLEYYIPAFYGEGIRYYARFRYDLTRQLRAEMRWEHTVQLGEVEDGPESRSRIKAQIRWRF